MVQGSRWPDLKVLVTGGSGFIGWHLCRRLCEEGSEVHATSRTAASDCSGRTDLVARGHGRALHGTPCARRGQT